jgi:transcriptional activator HAC1
MDLTMDIGQEPMSYYQDYPTPSTTSQAESTPPPSDPPKKKRKAWGQPVPEIKQILPPRKRAKTAEEKEQRKNERILRNRRAADKSRQRQKAAVAELEVKTGRIERENAHLRDLLTKYQQRFGVPEGFQFSQLPIEDDDDLDVPSPISLNNDATTSLGSPYQTPAMMASPHPTLAKTEAIPQILQESPALTPTLVDTTSTAKPVDNLENALAAFPSTSVLTHYPAAIMCDLQCQTENGTTKLKKLLSQATTTNGLSYLLLAMHYLTIFQTYSNTMLWPMFQVFRILEQRLDASSVETTFQSITHSFPLIHSLISQPSTATRKAVFRLKLLSRLLACSPLMARLLMAATDRALQLAVSSDGFAEDPARRWSWASLMTIKWGILRLEREHRKLRRVDVTEQKSLEGMCGIQGVDVSMVARSKGLWNQPATGKCITTNEESRATAQAVH